MRISRAVVLLLAVGLLATGCPRPTRPVRALAPPFRGDAVVTWGYRTAPLRTCDPVSEAYWGTCLYHPQSAVDFAVPYGSPVRAMEAGFVVMRDQEHDGEGDPVPPTTTTTTTAPPPPTTVAPPTTTTSSTVAPTTTLVGPTTTVETVELDAEPIADTAGAETAYPRSPGMFVVLDHRAGHPGYRPPDFTRYSHLSAFSWAELGRWVKRGQIIGYAGNTQIPGGSTHVHVDALYGLDDFSPTGGFNTPEHFADLGRFCWREPSGRVRIRWTSQFDRGQRLHVAGPCR